MIHYKPASGDKPTIVQVITIQALLTMMFKDIKSILNDIIILIALIILFCNLDKS